MLIRLLRFGASRVDDIMVPRADIIAVEETEPIGEVVRLFEEAGISRIPIYHETLDDPRGMVHIKDLFRWISAEAAGRPLVEPRLKGEERAVAVRKVAADDVAENGERKHNLSQIDLKRPISAAKIRRPVLYVPPSMPAMSLLIRMQTSRMHMALVVDEYGGTDGLVTIEDLVEQIVGDIEDEHDEAEAEHIIEDAKLGTIASGRTPVSELEELVGTKLLTEDEEEDIDTLGGLVFAIVGRVPTRGEIIRHASGLEFEIFEADPRRVKRLKILRPRTATSKPAERECREVRYRGHRLVVTAVARLRALRDRLRALSGWQRASVLVSAGLASVLAFAPFFVWPILFLTLPVLYWLITPRSPEIVSRAVLRRAFVDGWWFGFGYFFAGLFWVGEAFLVEADIFGWLLPFAVTLLPAGLALFFGSAAAISRALWRPGLAGLLITAVVFAGAEWLRGHLLTGFPWNVLGYALTGSDSLMQSAGLVGIYGLSLWAVLIFTAPLVLAADADSDESSLVHLHRLSPSRSSRWRSPQSMAPQCSRQHRAPPPMHPAYA